MTVPELIKYIRDNDLKHIVLAAMDGERKIHFQWTAETMFEVHNFFALGAAFATQMLLFGDPTDADLEDAEAVRAPRH